MFSYQHLLRGTIGSFSEDEPSFDEFATSEDVDLIDELGVNHFYDNTDSEDESENESFATSRWRWEGNYIRHCFRWHYDLACRQGSRAGKCMHYWSTKCIYCRSYEKADKVTGKCTSSGGGNDGEEHCFRWHYDAGCRRGSRSGRCIRGWTEKCIMCRQGQRADKRTGECVDRDELMTMEQE